VGLAFCAEMTENKAIMDAMDKYFIMKRWKGKKKERERTNKKEKKEGNK
jgi:hypothetical protein